MDAKTTGAALAGLGTTVLSLVIPEMLPADPATKAFVLKLGLVLSVLLYLLACIFWRLGRKEPDAKVAGRLAKGITEAINHYKENDPGGLDWNDRAASMKQSDVASRRLLERYRTDYQGEVLALLRRMDAKGKDMRRLITYAEHPTNPLGVEEIARELGALSHER